MQIKQVYVNDAVIGEAQTWRDVEKLLREKNVQFEGKPRAVEGPAAFFLHGTLAAPESRESNKSVEAAKLDEPVIGHCGMTCAALLPLGPVRCLTNRR
jgi:hypothetical protein